MYVLPYKNVGSMAHCQRCRTAPPPFSVWGIPWISGRERHSEARALARAPTTPACITLIAIFTAVATASLLVTPAAAARPTGPRGLRNWDGIGRPGAARSHGVAARAEDPEGAPWPIHLQHTIGLGSWRCPCADVSR
jgi:hypothetical protein